MTARTGNDFLAGLRDRRAVWIGDQKVTDVTDHPALRGAARALAGVFDLQHAAAADCLVPDPHGHDPINVSHLIPRSKEDLQRRHRAGYSKHPVQVGEFDAWLDAFIDVFSRGTDTEHNWRLALECLTVTTTAWAITAKLPRWKRERRFG